MIINKKNIIRSVILIAGVSVFGIYVWTSDVPWPSESPDSTSLPQAKLSETESSSPAPQATPRPIASNIPLSTGDGRTTFIDEVVPWSLLLGQASCRLQGEIKFLNHNTYDNQDALFIYGGVDHPGRNIFWTVTPQDDISVGPNMFGKLVLPNGESLLSITLPENPKHKRYELTVKIHYGRLVDEKDNFVTVGGNVKVFEKQCDGKTTVVLP
ncbi:MAG TPA: hypothetical protein VJC06_02625 [Candidatus Paceibacterota bacterium]